MDDKDLIKKIIVELIDEEQLDFSGYFFGLPKDSNSLKDWNIIILRRTKLKPSIKNQEGQQYYQLSVIHENYIPNQVIQKLIDKLQSKNNFGIKFKVENSDIPFNYSTKTNTNVVVESATITFSRMVKNYG